MLDHRSDDERSDADGELAQAQRRLLGRHRVVGRRDDPHAAADDLAVHARDDRLRATRHRENDAREAHEEFFAGCRVADRRQLIERRAGAERARPVAAQQDDANIVALPDAP